MENISNCRVVIDKNWDLDRNYHYLVEFNVTDQTCSLPRKNTNNVDNSLIYYKQSHSLYYGYF
nr:hypothetical protein [Dinophyceae sp. MRD-151]